MRKSLHCLPQRCSSGTCSLFDSQSTVPTANRTKGLTLPIKPDRAKLGTHNCIQDKLRTRTSLFTSACMVDIRDKRINHAPHTHTYTLTLAHSTLLREPDSITNTTNLKESPHVVTPLWIQTSNNLITNANNTHYIYKRHYFSLSLSLSHTHTHTQTRTAYMCSSFS